jgi:hypothetical protein
MSNLTSSYLIFPSVCLSLSVCRKANSAGAVYIFRLGSNSGNWKQKQKLAPSSDLAGFDLFGTSVALWENRLVVGAAGTQVDGECGEEVDDLGFIFEL